LYGAAPRTYTEQPKSGQQHPYVKICGLTRLEDVLFADSLGTDLLGFIVVDGSPRRVTPAFIRTLPPTKALKVGVVRLDPGQKVPDELAELIDEGLLDALQFHGTEDAELVDAWSTHAYKAVGLRGEGSFAPWGQSHGQGQTSAPRILMDASAPDGSSGGTGTPVAEDELAALATTPFGGSRLWLAGGLSPDNIAAVVARWRPELVDASSRLESAPGVKDPTLVKKFLTEIQNARR